MVLRWTGPRADLFLAKQLCSMTHPEDWDTAQQKLKSLFPIKTACGDITEELLNKEVDRRLQYLQDEDEVVKRSLKSLLTRGGPLTCGHLTIAGDWDVLAHTQAWQEELLPDPTTHELPRFNASVCCLCYVTAHM